jgi:hypothetical protein
MIIKSFHEKYRHHPYFKKMIKDKVLYKNSTLVNKIATHTKMHAGFVTPDKNEITPNKV